MRDLLAGSDEYVGEIDRSLHRRLDGVEPEGVRNLLGFVDDVVERGREPVAVARIEWRAHATAVEPMDQVVRDPVALLLAEPQVLRQRRPLRVVGQEIAQEQRSALHVAAGFLEQPQQRLV